MDPADERLPEEPPAEQPPAWRAPTIPPRSVGPIGPAPWYGLHPYAAPLQGPTPLATWSLIFSIIALALMLGCWPLSPPTALAAAVLAIIVKRRNKQAPEGTTADGQATAALIISGIILALATMGFATWMIMLGTIYWGGGF